MKKLIFAVLIFGFFSCSPKLSTVGKEAIEESESYHVEFVNAARVNGNPDNNLSVVFLVTPKNENSFPPLLSMGLRYIVDGEETYVNLRQQEGEGWIKLVIYGDDVEDKSPKIYSMIKDEIQIDEYEDMLLLVFEFKDKIEMEEKEMSIIYGLWEKDNQNKRIEKRYDFLINNIDL